MFQMNFVPWKIFLTVIKAIFSFKTDLHHCWCFGWMMGQPKTDFAVNIYNELIWLECKPRTERVGGWKDDEEEKEPGQIGEIGGYCRDTIEVK